MDPLTGISVAVIDHHLQPCGLEPKHPFARRHWDSIADNYDRLTGLRAIDARLAYVALA